MTDYQIVKFIENRAAQNSASHGYRDPRVVIYWISNRAFIGVKFSNVAEPFIMRFTKGNQRGLFKLQNRDDIEWCSSIVASCGHYDKTIIDYDIAMLPKSIKHFVSYAIIEALQTQGYGFDIFSQTEIDDDIELIGEKETYAEVSIEVDMLGI